ncbi:MAG: NADH-quinone oxidoreductase subunit C [Nitrospirae bacterium]|nr:NADH-quinone oxidoreductase subunit C [Nitrospirota bacterium]
MESIQIAEKIKEKFQEDVLDIVQFLDQVSVIVRKDRIVGICRFLHDDPDLYFDYLADICGVDYPDREMRFEVVYNLYSIKHRHRILLKALVKETDPSIDSAMPVWIGANWHEREVYDMYGITFNGHPDLRRILLPEDWTGYPLRKDYPLKGQEEYRGYEEIKKLHSHDGEWGMGNGK